MRVTPDIALRWLERNDMNRGVRLPRIGQYAADMRAGAWAVNGETLKFAEGGRLLDGQHRLQAVLEADVEVEMIVVMGLDPAVRETMDQGLPRQLCDAFRLRGEKEYNALAAAAKIVCLYERDGVPFKARDRLRPTTREAIAALDRNPELRASVTRASRRKVKWLPYSTLAAVHYLFASADADAAETYVEGLTEGAGLVAGDAVLVLRERLQANAMRPPGARGLTEKQRLAALVGAWNSHVAGRQVRRLDVSGEPFPGIAGLAR